MDPYLNILRLGDYIHGGIPGSEVVAVSTCAKNHRS